jgi:hypothetical protein
VSIVLCYVLDTEQSSLAQYCITQTFKSKEEREQHNTTQHNTTTTQARNQESKRQYINWLSPPLEYKGIGKTERRN